MNPGVTEEVSKTAQTVVEAMKSTPGTLAIVVFNVIFMFLVAYLSIQSGNRYERESARWQEMMTTVLKACTPEAKT